MNGPLQGGGLRPHSEYCRPKVLSRVAMHWIIPTGPRCSISCCWVFNYHSKIKSKKSIYEWMYFLYDLKVTLKSIVCYSIKSCSLALLDRTPFFANCLHLLSPKINLLPLLWLSLFFNFKVFLIFQNYKSVAYIFYFWWANLLFDNHLWAWKQTIKVFFWSLFLFWNKSKGIK